MPFKLLSWNVARSKAKLSAQVKSIGHESVDVLALQEVSQSTDKLFKQQLLDIGLPHIVSSFDLAPDPTILTGPRQYGQILASRYPLTTHDPSRFDVPWPERILSATAETPPSVRSNCTLPTFHPARPTAGLRLSSLRGCTTGWPSPRRYLESSVETSTHLRRSSLTAARSSGETS